MVWFQSSKGISTLEADFFADSCHAICLITLPALILVCLQKLRKTFDGDKGPRNLCYPMPSPLSFASWWRLHLNEYWSSDGFVVQWHVMYQSAPRESLLIRAYCVRTCRYRTRYPLPPNSLPKLSAENFKIFQAIAMPGACMVRLQHASARDLASSPSNIAAASKPRVPVSVSTSEASELPEGALKATLPGRREGELGQIQDQRINHLFI